MREHEHRDVDARRLLLFGAGLCIVIVLSLAGMDLLLRYFAWSQGLSLASSGAAMKSQELPPQPRLQVTPHADLEQKRKQEDAVLNSYGWVDRKAGTVRIPIDRAMRLLAQRGLPPPPVTKTRSKR